MKIGKLEAFHLFVSQEKGDEDKFRFSRRGKQWKRMSRRRRRMVEARKLSELVP